MLAITVRLLTLLTCLSLLATLSVDGSATRVLIISGLSGDQKESDRLTGQRQRLAADFAKRGLPAGAIEQAGDLKRDAILARLTQAAAQLHADDTFWLILLGHSVVRDDGPVFEVSGKRLTSLDLKTALGAIPARQYLLLTTEASGAFIADLAAPNRLILTATEATGEVNEPVFPDALADALEDAQNRSLLQLAQAAAKKVREHYDQDGLVQTEHAMLSDPSQPGPLMEPFDKTSGSLLADQTALPSSSPAAPDMTADQNALPAPPETKPTTSEPTASGVKPATPETLAIIKQANAAAARPAGFPALILSKEVDCLVNGDQSQVMTTRQQVLIEKASGARWGDLEFSSTPPLEQITVQNARTIFPDGSYLEAVIDSRNEFTSGDYLARKNLVVRLPAVKPGCVLDYTVREEQSPDNGVSGVYQEIPVTDAVPILVCHFTLRLPKDHSIQYRLRNLMVDTAGAGEDGAYSHVDHWSWNNLPAVEHLPNDPPLRDVEGLVLLSSYKSWNDFAAWFYRIAKGSDEAGEGVKSRAAALTAGLKTDREKLRALFEDVSKIRYAAIEIGVGAFRPHTPEAVLQSNYGDCKDKANLLIALARQVGIEGKLVLLNRTSSTDPTFPGFQFNHAIAYFPNIDGGLFLDATDEVTAFGQLPPGDVGRNALLMSAEPTFKTIPIPPAQATQMRVRIVLDSSGKTAGHLTVDTQGIADYELRNELRNLTARQTDAFFQGQVNDMFPGATVRSYTMSDLGRLDEPARVECSFDLMPGTASEMARLPHLPMNLLDDVTAPDRPVALMLNDGQPFLVEQTLDISGASSVAPPEKSEFSAPGATASITYSSQANTLTRHVVINVTQPTISTKDYPAFREMIHQVYTAILNTPSPHT